MTTPKTSLEPTLLSPTRLCTSRKEKDKEAHTKQPNLIQPERKISGCPSGDKHHTFQVKRHILRKRIRKLYLKCRVTNCKQAFQSFHSIKALNVHHSIFTPKLYLSVRCVQRSTALPVQPVITDMNIKAQVLPALRIKKLLCS